MLRFGSGLAPPTSQIRIADSPKNSRAEVNAVPARFALPFRQLTALSAFALGVTLVLDAGGEVSSYDARRQTTVWQRVKAPDAASRERLLDMADRKREPRDETYDAEAIRTQLHRASATLLALAHVETL